MKALLLTLALALAAQAEDVRLYYGSADADAPVTVDAREAFSHIAEYTTIVREGYGAESPEYWILLERANRRFYAALDHVARKMHVEAVLEARGRDSHTSEDITSIVVAELSR